MARLVDATEMLGGPDETQDDTSIVLEASFQQFSGKLFGYFEKIKGNRIKIIRTKERIELDNERRERRIGFPQAVKEETSAEKDEEGIGGFLKKLLIGIGGVAKTFIAGLKAFFGKMKKLILPAILAVKTALKIFLKVAPRIFPWFALAGVAYYAKDIIDAFKGKEVPPVSATKEEREKFFKEMEEPEPELTDEDFGSDGDDTQAPAARVSAQPAEAPPPVPQRKPTPPARPAAVAPPAPAPPAPAAASAPPPAAAPAAEPAPKPKAEEQGKPEKVASPKERAKKEFGALDKGQALANQVGKIDDELEKLKEQADNIENDDDPKKVALMKRIEELENKRDNVSKQQDSLDKPDKFDKFAAKKTKGDRAFDEDAKGKPDRIDKALDDDGEIRKPKIPAGAPTKVTQTTTKESEETTTGGGSTLSSRVSDKPSEEYLAAEKKYKDALAELKAARKIKAPKDKIKELMNKVSEYRKAKSKLKPKTRMATSTIPSELKSNKTKVLVVNTNQTKVRNVMVGG